MRLRDASSETLKNSDPISESVIKASAKSSIACVIVSRRIAGGPATVDTKRDNKAGLAVCPSADARATTTSIAERRRT